MSNPIYINFAGEMNRHFQGYPADSKVCPECNGDGETHYSCCGDNVYNTEAEDFDLCPTCKEHLPGRETCETCDGEGWI